MAEVLSISLAKIVPGNNPREDLGDVAGLAESIRDRGLLQPIRVKKGKTGLFVIITGHRRFEAHRLLGKKAIDAIVVEDAGEGGEAVDRIVENLQREDLRPFELAKGIEALSRSFKLADEAIGRSIGKSVAVVKQWRLLSRVPDDILERIGTAESVATGDAAITPRHLARVLAQIGDDSSDPKKRRAREERLADVREFIAKVEAAGSLNAHQADAVWRMVLSGEAGVADAVDIVAQSPDEFRYKRSGAEVPLPPAIDSGADLERETYQYLLNLAASIRTQLSQAKPEVVGRLSESYRADLIPTWEHAATIMDSILESMRRRDGNKRIRRLTKGSEKA
jgi:ParB/RepB/Spo0J family partition protein